MSKHTPGPWKYDGEHVTDSTETVISIEGISQPHGVVPQDHVSRANARLIAAAPELLEACRMFVNAAYKPCGHDFDCICAGDAARAAIAKAEGRS